MNQRSKRAWIENVAWTLVLSMSLLQLVGASVVSRANAQGQAYTTCWTRKPLGPARVTDCGTCDSGGCTGRAFRAKPCDWCDTAPTGFVMCETSTWKRVEVGTWRSCNAKRNYPKMIACAGTGVIAAIVAMCTVTCTGSGPGFPGCMSICCSSAPGWVPVVYGGVGGTATCFGTCFAVDYCYESSDEFIVTEKDVQLYLDGCKVSL